MKTLIAIALIAGLMLPLGAQDLGLRAGMDLYRFHQFRDKDKEWDNSDKYTPGPTFGINFRLPFKERSALRTGLYYSDVHNLTDLSKNELKIKFLKIPVHYGFTVIKEPLRTGFFFGPNLGIGLKGDYTDTGIRYDIYRDEAYLHKRIFVGAGAGVRAEYYGICLELQYNFDFLVPSGGFGSNPEFLMANEVLSFWIGYSYSFEPKPHRYERRR